MKAAQLRQFGRLGALGVQSHRVRGLAVALVVTTIVGCSNGPSFHVNDRIKSVDRGLVEYPSGYSLNLVAEDLTGPNAIAFGPDGIIYIAEGARDYDEPRITGFRSDGSSFAIHPFGGQGLLDAFSRRFRMYGPVGGMIYHDGLLFVSHRDKTGMGAISSIEPGTGIVKTVVADLPARGDHAVGDIAVSPSGRFFFSVGSATNSGVVGLDNWEIGWVRNHPDFSDQPWTDLKLLGYHFKARNPAAGLFGGDDLAVTAPFQPFGVSEQTRLPRSPTDKPTAAIFSISPAGGDLKLEASGVRHVRGLGFNEYGRLYATNQGMELRGTRPVKDDPDVLLRVVPGTWYGWPDFTSDLNPISDPAYHPPTELIRKSGYPELGALIDHDQSGLVAPTRATLLQATFTPLSGVSKFGFVPENSPFAEFAGSAIVALAGDRAPFASGGLPLSRLAGYRIVRVDVDTRQMSEFIYNTRGEPRSKTSANSLGLERPVDVKFGPDGSLYIVDAGRMTMDGGRERYDSGTGRLYRLEPMSAPTTRSASPPVFMESDLPEPGSDAPGDFPR